MKRAVGVFLGVFCVAASAALSGAEVPAAINLHGQLLSSTGTPLAGARAYEIKFYSAATEGTQLGATIAGVAGVSPEGLFDLAVVPPAAALDASECWYELSIESDATPDGNLLPSDLFGARVRVYSVPFALRAGAVAPGGLGSGLLSNDELDALDGIQSNIQAQLNDKPSLTDLNAALSPKANVSDVYTKAEIDSQQAAVNTALSHVLSWSSVSANTQAVANHGYLANSDAQLVFTLPAEGDVSVGDIVRINGIGTGGWKVTQNFGQASVIPNSAGAWIPRYLSAFWSGLACSMDGKNLVGCVQGNRLYTSADGGANWTARESDRQWSAVASSGDGSKLVACENGGKIYTSTDAGATWTPRDSDRAWKSVTSSRDGVNLAACDYLGTLYTSTDSGETWTSRDSSRNWVDVASSADGSVLVAAVFGGQIYTSTDSGANWAPRDTDRNWIAVDASADGTMMVACVNSGFVYLSMDSGAHWSPTDSMRGWWDIQISDDGLTVLAADQGRTLFLTRDFGSNWSPEATQRSWTAVAMSSDATQLYAAAALDYIYAYSPSTRLTPTGLEGELIGKQYSAIELQYAGGGIYTPLSHEGTVTNK